mmetsp:Transcript_42068/g.44095  ORF Transcript_42068/g.44095 Transcript_42068/m.44095 type:complete len:178 (-) Transcript_42068:116-649(-)
MIKETNPDSLKTTKQNNEQCLVVPIRIKQPSDSTQKESYKKMLNYLSDYTLTECVKIPGMQDYSNQKLLFINSGQLLVKSVVPWILGMSMLMYRRFRKKREWGRFKALSVLSVLNFSCMIFLNMYFITGNEIIFEQYIHDELYSNQGAKNGGNEKSSRENYKEFQGIMKTWEKDNLK